MHTYKIRDVYENIYVYKNIITFLKKILSLGKSAENFYKR